MECISKRQLLARASILIKKDFTILGQRDFIKKLSNVNYVYIVCQRVSSPWDRTQALTYAIRAVSLPFFFFLMKSNARRGAHQNDAAPMNLERSLHY